MNNLPEPFQPPEPATGRFQGLELTAGLPLAASMGRLANRTPAPKGLRWHTPPPNPWQFRNQVVDPVS